MIRVGLIGFGLAGRAFHAPLISSVSGLELAAVMERHSDEAAKLYPDITTHRSVEAMLGDPALDLIVVATPSGTHFDVARQVIASGRHLIVDKPVATRSAEIAELMTLARQRGVRLIPFHNRRWDGDFRTVEGLLREGTLGRLVQFASHIDRWSPGNTRRPWKDDPEQGGGVLLDLGTHLVDQALALFGRPSGVSAEVLRERDGEGANDAFEIRLRYAEFRVTLEANALSSPAAPRFVVRGTKGSFRKKGVDPQEAALKNLSRITSEDWGNEPAHAWGMLHVDVDGGMVTRPLETLPGDYRRFYAGLRDTLEAGAAVPVQPVEAWRTARVLEWATESSNARREIECDWSMEPA